MTSLTKNKTFKILGSILFAVIAINTTSVAKLTQAQMYEAQEILLNNSSFLQEVRQQVSQQMPSRYSQQPDPRLNLDGLGDAFGDLFKNNSKPENNRAWEESPFWKNFEKGLEGVGKTAEKTFSNVCDGISNMFRDKSWGEIIIATGKKVLPVVGLITAVALVGIAMNQLRERVGKPALMINPGKQVKTEVPTFEGEIKQQLDSYINRARAAMIHNKKLLSTQPKVEIQPLILYGPGGTGKTMFAQYIAKALGNAPFNMLTGGSFKNFARRGEHINEARKLFKFLSQSKGRVCLFDEIASLATANPDDIASQEVLDEVKAWTGGNALSQNIIIFTTNTLKIDPAFLTRCKVIYVGLPNVEAREKILLGNLRSRSLLGVGPFNQTVIRKVAELTKGWCGRTLNFFVNEAFGEYILHGKRYTEDHILELAGIYNRNLAQLQFDSEQFAASGELIVRQATT